MSTTPLLRQYFAIKEQHPDTLLLFQVGDFYEIFFDDAKKAAAFLGITLTKRGTHNGEPVPLCGVPLHTLDHYLVKLVKGGFRVAVCDQLEVARPGKVVERGITQILTPGTLTDSKLLDDKSASYCSVLFPTSSGIGCLFVELLTGHIFVTRLMREDTALLEAELRRFSPDEIVIPVTKLGKSLEQAVRRLGYVTTSFDFTGSDFVENVSGFDDWFASCTMTARDLIDRSDTVTSALKLFFSFLQKNQEHALAQCKQIFFYSPDDFLMLDASTQRNLELVKNLQDGSSANTLFAVIDRAVTAMGSRMIKKWLVRPLVKRKLIEQRLDIVELFLQHVALTDTVAGLLQDIGDIERVVGRIALQRAHQYDYVALMRALKVFPDVAAVLQHHEQLPLLHKIVQMSMQFADIAHLLSSALEEDTASDWIIKPGYNQELDRLRGLMHEGAHAIAELERAEQQRTGIQSLKIRYNRVQGYAVEITKANLDAVPEDYQRLQTLVNRERFTLQALKDLEYDITRAKVDGLALEKDLYEQVKAEVEKYCAQLKTMTQALAHCDALLGFARTAYQYNFKRPRFHQEDTTCDITIIEGRHPVVAAQLEHEFIPNDTVLSDVQSTWIITGPNMGGKSTYLRQVALLAILAQCGSFVSAEKAELPLLDRIFTRIGAADNVAEGKSTFLVEMEETALICNQATEKSLVILDEVGRGTSTYDGLAIAQAVVEYLHTQVKARALFATHYHELTMLSEVYPGIVSYHAASKQTESGIILLHKIAQGSADGSFGIEVAKRVQLPETVLSRAQSILSGLKAKESSTIHTQSAPVDQTYELHQKNVRIAELEQALEQQKRLVKRIFSLDYNALSPKQAFDLLWELKSDQM